MQDQKNNFIPPFSSYNQYGMTNNYRYNNYNPNSVIHRQEPSPHIENENYIYNNSFNDSTYETRNTFSAKKDVGVDDHIDPTYQYNTNYVQNVENSRNVEDNSETREFFEIFGLKLYFDDILLICLIFLLYKEDVHDEMLFIALVLLLLS